MNRIVSKDYPVTVTLEVPCDKKEAADLMEYLALHMVQLNRRRELAGVERLAYKIEAGR